MNNLLLKIIVTKFLIIAVSISANAQSIKLPDQSNIYPDTFAIYWRTDKARMPGDSYAFQLSIASSYGGLEFKTEKSVDSIVSVPFSEDHVYEAGLLMNGIFFRNGEKISDRLRYAEKMLRVLSKSDKIEVCKLMVETNANIQNLKLLADAFEEEQCFVNALHIYTRMISKEPAEGRKYFLQFYIRNYKILNPVRNSVHR
jgi:hypothetical protein